MSFKEITTALGSADQILGVSHSGGSLEYKTIAAGSGITVTPTAGTLTIAASATGGSVKPVTAGYYNFPDYGGQTLAGICPGAGSDNAVYTAEAANTSGVAGGIWRTTYDGITSRIATFGVAGTPGYVNFANYGGQSSCGICQGGPNDNAIYIAEGANPAAGGQPGGLWRITSNGAGTKIATFAAAGTAVPGGMCLGPDNNIWVMDNSILGSGQRGIYRVTPQGVVTSFYSNTFFSSSLSGAAICAGPDGNIWIVAGGNVFVISVNGTFLATYTSATTNLAGSSNITSIVAGPDGNLWVTNAQNAQVIKLTTAGVGTALPVTGMGYYKAPICVGSDGRLWFADGAPGSTAGIWALTTSGSLTNYAVTAGAYVGSITSGPDGNLWVASGYLSAITKVTTAGVATSMNNISGVTSGFYGCSSKGQLWFVTNTTNTTTNCFNYSFVNFATNSICTGPDGNIWATDNSNYQGRGVWKVTPQGVSTLFSSNTFFANSLASATMCAGGDGNLWVQASGNLYVVSTAGAFLNTYVAATTNISGTTNFNAMVAGPDGNVWVSNAYGQQIVKVTPSGVGTTYALTSITSSANNPICVGPDGNLWVVDSAGTTGMWSITTSGTVTNYPNGVAGTSITAGPDGNLWVVDGATNTIYQITTAGIATAQSNATGTHSGAQFVCNSDGQLWFATPDVASTSVYLSTRTFTAAGQALINFGYTSEDVNAKATIPCSWVQSTSIFSVTPSGIATYDHDPDDYTIENISAYVTNIVPGVSFDVIGVAPNGTWGAYLINIIGVA